jgi:hypothetical protein
MVAPEDCLSIRIEIFRINCLSQSNTFPSRQISAKNNLNPESTLVTKKITFSFPGCLSNSAEVEEGGGRGRETGYLARPEIKIA